MVDVTGEATFEAGSDFRVGDILGRSLSVFGRDLGKFVLVCGLAMLPDLIISLQASRTGAGRQGWNFVAQILQTMGQVLVIWIASARLSGRQPRIVEAVRDASARFRPAILVVVMQGVTAFVGAVLLVVPGFFVVTVLYVALPVCVIEQAGAVASLKRSALLTKGHRWSVFGFLLVANVVPLLVIGTASVLSVRFGGQAAAECVLYILQLVFTPFAAIAATVLYHALRIAKEGPGIAVISEVFA